MFWVTGLKILGRVGTHIFFFLLEKNTILCVLKGILPFKMHKIIYFFSRKLEKFPGFTSKFRQVRVILNTGILFALKCCSSDFIWDFGKLPFPAHLEKYIIKNGKISTKIHEIGKIKTIFGLGTTPI